MSPNYLYDNFVFTESWLNYITLSLELLGLDDYVIHTDVTEIPMRVAYLEVVACCPQIALILKMFLDIFKFG